MPLRQVEFDGRGQAEADLARLWCAGKQGERNRITKAAAGAEKHLRKHPDSGKPLTNGVNPPVRYLDFKVLRVFYQDYETLNKVIIIGFKSL
jgi:hypothetical protein